MRRSLTRFFLIYTIVGLLASIVIHFSLYFGLSLYDRSPILWLLMQVGVFGGLIGALLLKPAERLPKDIGDRRAPKLFVAMAILISFLFFYTPINFLYCDHKLKSGYPYMVDGQRFLYLPRGAHYRKLTPEQFREAELYQARKTSGHWMIILLFPLMGLYTSYKWERFDS